MFGSNLMLDTYLLNTLHLILTLYQNDGDGEDTADESHSQHFSDQNQDLSVCHVI